MGMSSLLDSRYIPVEHDWRLNERHYGALQGMDKQQTVEKYGKDQVMIWRRSYDIPPPNCNTDSEYYPGNDDKFADVDKAELPLAESLKDTEARFLPCWHESIAPQIKAGKNVSLPS